MDKEFILCPAFFVVLLVSLHIIHVPCVTRNTLIVAHRESKAAFALGPEPGGMSLGRPERQALKAMAWEVSGAFACAGRGSMYLVFEDAGSKAKAG